MDELGIKKGKTIRALELLGNSVRAWKAGLETAFGLVRAESVATEVARGKKSLFWTRHKSYSELQADHSRGAGAASKFNRETFSSSIYGSFVVFEKGDIFRKESLQRGDAV